LGDDGVMTVGTSGAGLGSVLTAVTTNRTLGGPDTVRGGTGDDVLVGGVGNDSIDGGSERDLVFGDNVSLDRTPPLGDVTNPRFRTLSAGTIYAATGDANVDGTPRLDPHGNPVWGDFVITLLDQGNAAPAGSYGDDYLAGGGNDDMLFGELGN